MKKVLIVWNVLLTLVAAFLLWQWSVTGSNKTTYDIAQDAVLCGYIEELQRTNAASVGAIPGQRILSSTRSIGRAVRATFGLIADFAGTMIE